MTFRRAPFSAVALVAGLALTTASCAGSSVADTSPTSTASNPTTIPDTASTSQPSNAEPGLGDIAMPHGALVVKGPVPAVGSTIDGSIKTPDGRTRTYHVYLPRSIESDPADQLVPLLVAMHGGTGWGTQFERTSGFDGLAEANGLIVAIGVQAAALEVAPCRPEHPVSVLHIHGDADQNLPIGGGLGPKAISGVAFSPPRDGAEILAAADRCPAGPTTATDPLNGDLTITSWSPCADGTQVAFVEVAGAAHAWMGSTGGGGPGAAPYSDLDSSLTIWNFLSQQSRP